MNQFVSEIACSQNNYWFLCSLGIDFFKRFSWLNLWKVTSTSACVSFCVVGNIPYEASEEQLKEIFSEVGPVVSFR